MRASNPFCSVAERHGNGLHRWLNIRKKGKNVRYLWRSSAGPGPASKAVDTSSLPYVRSLCLLAALMEIEEKQAVKRGLLKNKTYMLNNIRKCNIM